MTHSSPLSRFRLAGRIFASLLAALLLAGCGTPKVEVEQQPASFWPPAPDEPRIQFLRSFEKSTDITPAKTGLDKVLLGEETESALQITKPYGVKMWQGKIYVCDTKLKAVAVLDIPRKVVRLMGVSGAHKLDNPTDIAIAPDGMKYVTDNLKSAVVVFDANDKAVGAFTHSNFKPVGVAVYQNELAVADFQMQRVEILDRGTGQVKKTIGTPGMKDGQFVRPLSVAYDAQGNLFVMDFMKCRMQKFDRTGKLILAIGEVSTAAGNFVRPKQITVDRDNYLYVVDAGFQNVQLFNSAGKLLTFFGAAGTHPGAMQLPAGITVTDNPQDLEIFKPYVHPAFNADRLIIVTNQFGPNRVAVYALGKLKPGVSVADISPSRIPVPLAATQPSTQPSTVPTVLPPEERSSDSSTTPASDKTTTPKP